MTRRTRGMTVLATVIVVIGFTGAFAPAWADKPQPPPTLQGEAFSGSPTFSNVSCNPSGTSTFDYSVSGTAAGAYAGTFTESGTVTVGPQSTNESIALGPFTLRYRSGTVADAEATFTIDSPAGTVTGTKTFQEGATGICANTATVSADFGDFSTPVAFREGFVLLDYSVTIAVPKRTYCDTGHAQVLMNQIEANDFNVHSATFTAGFDSTLDSANRPHGHHGC